LAPWIRICIEIKSWILIRRETSADPQHRFYSKVAHLMRAVYSFECGVKAGGEPAATTARQLAESLSTLPLPEDYALQVKSGSILSHKMLRKIDFFYVNATVCYIM
jgi:hypothetical protein